MSTRQTIADYWTSKAGQEKILEIGNVYGISMTGLLCIEQDIAHCWACNRTLRGGRHGYGAKDLGLDRCHIVPRCLGGSDDPTNLLLMCKRCHQESPDTNDPVHFWSWFDRVEAHDQREVIELKKALDLSPIDVTPAPSIEEMVLYIDRAAKDLGITTHGASIAQGTRVVLLQKALSIRACNNE